MKIRQIRTRNPKKKDAKSFSQKKQFLEFFKINPCGLIGQLVVHFDFAKNCLAKRT